jgi:hypothetical protein
MLESAKGFWKVKSIHKLTNRLNNRYNYKDYIILKTIKKPAPKVPSYISFEHKTNRNIRNLENQKNYSSADMRVGNFFITGSAKRINNQKNKKKNEEIKIIYRKLYGQFKYEPFLYNDCQFFYLQKEQRFLPRKFKDVVKDCMAFQEYKNHIKFLQQNKNENETNENNKNINDNKNLSFAAKEPVNYLNIFEKDINDKNVYLIKHKIKRKCFSSYDIRERKNKRDKLLQSGDDVIDEVKTFPKIRIKSMYKSKSKLFFV